MPVVVNYLRFWINWLLHRWINERRVAEQAAPTSIHINYINMILYDV